MGNVLENHSAQGMMERLAFYTIVVSTGLLVVSISYTGARIEAWWAVPLYWAGMTLMVFPLIFNLTANSLSRIEYLSIIVIITVGLYMIKIMHSPLFFTFPDELQHWRTASDILRTNELFNENSILTISPLFPGLEIAVLSIVATTGLSIFAAATLLLLLARVLLTVVLFAMYERASTSAQVAALATLVYMANPNYLYFGSQFAYETLAIPLAGVVLLAVMERHGRGSGDAGMVWVTAAIVTGTLAVVSTHHLSSYALTGFLLLVTVSVALDRMRRRAGAFTRPGSTLLLSLVASMAWLVYIGSLVVGYLAPNLFTGVTELLKLMSGELTNRELFRDFAGETPPLAERLLGFLSVGLLVSFAPVGVWMTWRRFGTQPLALAYVIGTMTYPASLGLRLVRRGAEISNRTSEFVFLALSFTIAVSLVYLCLKGSPSRRRRFAVATWVVAVLFGGVIIGWGHWARMPGPYRVIGDSRAIDSYSLAVTDFMLKYTREDGRERFIADRVYRLVLGSYGHLRNVFSLVDNPTRKALWDIWFAEDIDDRGVSLLQQAEIDFIVVDQRLGNDLPLSGVYVEQGEPDTFQHRTPIPWAALVKFDRVPGLSRIMDAGAVVVYDTSGLTDAR